MGEKRTGGSYTHIKAVGERSLSLFLNHITRSKANGNGYETK